MPFCKDCRKACGLKDEDFGIGPGEAFGVRFVDKDVRTVTDCCESENYCESEEDFCEGLQYELSERLSECDPLLPLSALLLIEQMLKPIQLPTTEKQVPRGKK